MNTDTQSGEIGNKNQPAVGMRLVRHIFPLQYQPEHYCREQGGESVYLTLYSAEPERITECVCQCTHQTAAHDSNQLSFGDVVFIGNNQFAYQVSDAPE